MRKLIIFILICATVKNVNAQTISEKIADAYKQFENDPQLKHAISSLYIIDAATGKIVFNKNSQIGLAPASSQKIITAATAFELLGKDYRYKTELGYQGEILRDSLAGDLLITGSFDPTFGSWRFSKTKADVILNNWKTSLKKSGIKRIQNIYYSEQSGYGYQSIPNGWIWQDIGNYYGAGCRPLNWKENQYDLFLQSEKKEGLRTGIQNYTDEPSSFDIDVLSAPKGSGDNAFIYLPPNSDKGYISGTIPVNQDSFKISGSLSNPPLVFLRSFLDSFLLSNALRTIWYRMDDIDDYNPKTLSAKKINLYTHYSPSLDSLVYWFLKKSINLYGEALIKTMAYEKRGFGATDTGIAIVKDFWKQKGIDRDELNIYDGSGLSPMNRITTQAQVEVLKYAKKQNWFRYFYEALPEYNGMKLKSGTIGDVKAFCGYHTSKDGKNYIISFIVNNYSGSSTTLVNKMYRILDILK